MAAMGPGARCKFSSGAPKRPAHYRHGAVILAPTGFFAHHSARYRGREAHRRQLRLPHLVLDIDGDEGEASVEAWLLSDPRHLGLRELVLVRQFLRAGTGAGRHCRPRLPGRGMARQQGEASSSGADAGEIGSVYTGAAQPRRRRRSNSASLDAKCDAQMEISMRTTLALDDELLAKARNSPASRRNRFWFAKP